MASPLFHVGGMGMALAAPKRKSRKAIRKKTRPASRLRFAFRAGVIGGLALFAGTIVWAGFYAAAPPPGTLTMLQRKMSGDVIIHPWTPLEKISPNLVTAVISAEDTRFCLHNGIDFEAVNKAMNEAENGKRLRGASTISQQTAKNAFLWNGGGWLRKGGEAWMTVLIETFWSKRRIMEVYLNVAEWGDGLFGAEAAAQARFGKPARDLTMREAALLASVLPNPHKWRVDPPGPYVRGRVQTVQKRMGVVRRDRLDACVVTP